MKRRRKLIAPPLVPFARPRLPAAILLQPSQYRSVTANNGTFHGDRESGFNTGRNQYSVEPIFSPAAEGFSGIFLQELPPDFDFPFIDAANPGGGPPSESFGVRYSIITQPLSSVHTDCDLSLIEPAGMLRRIVDVETGPEPLSRIFTEAIDQRLFSMGR